MEPATAVRIRPGLWSISLHKHILPQESHRKCRYIGADHGGRAGRISSRHQCRSGSVVRPIISAFRAEDSGSNPGRSISFLKLGLWHCGLDDPGANALEGERLQKFDFIWGKGLDRYRLIPKLSIYLYSKEENKDILPEQNTQILVRMHEVQVLHLMKIL